MKVPTVLMILTVLLLCLAAYTAWGEGRRKTMIDLVFDGAQIESREKAKEEVKDVDIRSIVDLENLWSKDDGDTDLWIRFVRGILRSRQKERINGTKYIDWEACGEDIPDEELYDRATTWALSIVTSLKEVEEQFGVKINPWGAFATTANEGGFNECSLNYAARKWASQHVGRELIEETWKGKTVKRKVNKKVVERFRLTYDRDTVWKIINHEDYADAYVWITTKGNIRKKVYLKNKFDGGPYQMRFSVKTVSREQFDYLLSIHPGVYLGLKEMARRAAEAQRWHRLDDPHARPWAMWPGYKSPAISHRYDRKIRSVARWLGARKNEI